MSGPAWAWQLHARGIANMQALHAQQQMAAIKAQQEQIARQQAEQLAAQQAELQRQLAAQHLAAKGEIEKTSSSVQTQLTKIREEQESHMKSIADAQETIKKLIETEHGEMKRMGDMILSLARQDDKLAEALQGIGKYLQQQEERSRNIALTMLLEIKRIAGEAQSKHLESMLALTGAPAVPPPRAALEQKA